MNVSEGCISTVLFDADGTILDNLPVLTEAVRLSVRKFLGQDVSGEEVLLQAKRSLPDYLRTLLPEGCQDPAKLLQDVRSDFELYYVEHSNQVTVFEGIRAMLNTLAGDYRLGIVSSRQTNIAGDLARLAIADYFEVVIDRNETKRHKPDPEPLLLACERLGVLPERAIYVGDAPADMVAARTAGMLSVAVTYGGNNLQELAAVRPDYIVESPAAVASLLVRDP